MREWKQFLVGMRAVPTLTCVEEMSGKEALAPHVNGHRPDGPRMVYRAGYTQCATPGFTVPPGFPMGP